MSLAYIIPREGQNTGQATLCEIVELTPGSPPPRPHPTPPDPNAPRPSHPIALPGDPWWGSDLHPEHPIVIPKPPVEIPPIPDPLPPDGMVKNPPATGGWGYNAKFGWGYFPGPTQPGPK